MIAEELWSAVLPVVQALEELRVPYYIGGSVASSSIGLARATMDADLIAALDLQRARPFHQALNGAYYADLERIETAVLKRRSVNLLHLATAYKIDLFIPAETAFDRISLQRRVSVAIPEAGRPLYFSSPEDIVLHKLKWYTDGGSVSDRQWYDIQGILRLRRSSLDQGYLETWAESLGLSGLLQRALAESGP